jgi:hypothetical protein
MRFLTTVILAAIVLFNAPSFGADTTNSKSNLCSAAFTDEPPFPSDKVEDSPYERDAYNRIPELQRQLAKIENGHPRGFNTYTVQKRDAMRLSIIAYLELGQERRVKGLIREVIQEFRATYAELKRQTALETEIIEQFRDADPQAMPIMHGLLNENRQNRYALMNQMGKSIWMYTGIVEALLEQAGLRPHPTLISAGMERTLLTDEVNEDEAVEEIKAAVKTLNPDEAAPAPAVAQQVALHVLDDLNIIDPATKKELEPSLAQLEELYQSTYIIRAAKLESEVFYERWMSRLQSVLSVASTDYLRSLMIAVFNGMTFGKLQNFFAVTALQVDLNLNARLHAGRVSEFINLSRRIPDTPAGNNQLAEALTRLMSTAPGTLSAIALRQDAISALARAKNSDYAKNTIWGPGTAGKPGTLAQLIAFEETRRLELGVTTASFNGSPQGHRAGLVAIAVGATAFLMIAQPEVDLQWLQNWWDAIKGIINFAGQ